MFCSRFSFSWGCSFLNFTHGFVFILFEDVRLAVSVVCFSLFFSCSCIVFRLCLRYICSCSRPAYSCLALRCLGSSHHTAFGVCCRALGFPHSFPFVHHFPSNRSSVSGSRRVCSCLSASVGGGLVFCSWFFFGWDVDA